MSETLNRSRHRAVRSIAIPHAAVKHTSTLWKALILYLILPLLTVLLTFSLSIAQNPTDAGKEGSPLFQTKPQVRRVMPKPVPVSNDAMIRVYEPTKHMTTTTSEPKPMQRVGADGSGDIPANTAPRKELSMARSLPARTAPQSIEDLERQISALQDKIAYAHEHPEHFADTDILKMEQAVQSKRDHVEALRRQQEKIPD